MSEAQPAHTFFTFVHKKSHCTIDFLTSDPSRIPDESTRKKLSTRAAALIRSLARGQPRISSSKPLSEEYVKLEYHLELVRAHLSITRVLLELNLSYELRSDDIRCLQDLYGAVRKDWTIEDHEDAVDKLDGKLVAIQDGAATSVSDASGNREGDGGNIAPSRRSLSPPIIPETLSPLPYDRDRTPIPPALLNEADGQEILDVYTDRPGFHLYFIEPEYEDGYEFETLRQNLNTFAGLLEREPRQEGKSKSVYHCGKLRYRIDLIKAWMPIQNSFKGFGCVILQTEDELQETFNRNISPEENLIAMECELAEREANLLHDDLFYESPASLGMDVDSSAAGSDLEADYDGGWTKGLTDADEDGDVEGDRRKDLSVTSPSRLSPIPTPSDIAVSDVHADGSVPLQAAVESHRSFIVPPTTTLKLAEEGAVQRGPTSIEDVAIRADGSSDSCPTAEEKRTGIEASLTTSTSSSASEVGKTAPSPNKAITSQVKRNGVIGNPRRTPLLPPAFIVSTQGSAPAPSDRVKTLLEKIEDQRGRLPPKAAMTSSGPVFPQPAPSSLTLDQRRDSLAAQVNQQHIPQHNPSSVPNKPLSSFLAQPKPNTFLPSQLGSTLPKVVSHSALPNAPKSRLQAPPLVAKSGIVPPLVTARPTPPLIPAREQVARPSVSSSVKPAVAKSMAMKPSIVKTPGSTLLAAPTQSMNVNPVMVGAQKVLTMPAPDVGLISTTGTPPMTAKANASFNRAMSRPAPTDVDKPSVDTKNPARVTKPDVPGATTLNPPAATDQVIGSIATTLQATKGRKPVKAEEATKPPLKRKEMEPKASVPAKRPSPNQPAEPVAKRQKTTASAKEKANDSTKIKVPSKAKGKAQSRKKYPSAPVIESTDSSDQEESEEEYTPKTPRRGSRPASIGLVSPPVTPAKSDSLKRRSESEESTPQGVESKRRKVVADDGQVSELPELVDDAPAAQKDPLPISPLTTTPASTSTSTSTSISIPPVKRSAFIQRLVRCQIQAAQSMQATQMAAIKSMTEMHQLHLNNMMSIMSQMQQVYQAQMEEMNRQAEAAMKTVQAMCAEALDDV